LRHRRFVWIALMLLACALAADGQEAGGGRSVWRYLFGYGFIVQILAVVHWARRGRDQFWIWIILIGGVIGALAYFLVESDWDVALSRPGQRRRITALRVMILDNPSAGNYEELGELLVQQKKWAEAREAFDRAIAVRSDLLDSFYWRGVAAFELGYDRAAIADLKAVVKKEPKYAYSRARCLLACALARDGRTAEAMAVFDRLVESSTSAESVVNAAEFFAANGREPAARDLVQTILARRVTMPAHQKRRERVFLRRAQRLARKLRG
jgi:hypothetical protein